MTESIVAEQPPTKKHIFGCAGVLLLVFLLYIPALGNYLQGDDFEWLNSIYDGWKRPGLFMEKINNFHRPLVKLSYLLNYTLFGTQVFYYNLFTVLLHLANLWLLFLLVLRLFDRTLPSALVVLAYGASAYYSEVTLWAAGRPDSLMMLFVLGALLVLARCADVEKGMPAGKRLLLLLLAVGALSAKESWVILPFLALAFLWLIRKFPLPRAFAHTRGLFILLGLYLAIFVGLPLLQGHTAFITYGRVGFPVMVHKAYLLAFTYFGLGGQFHGAWWQFLLLTLLGGAGIFYLIRRNNRPALLGLFWMLLGLGISLPIYHVPAPRYNYIPLMGFWIMVVSFFRAEYREYVRGHEKSRRLAALLLGLPLLLILAHQAIMLQLEIGDYRLRGQLHQQVAGMYERVRGAIPLDRPLLFIDLGKRQAVQEAAAACKGYNKLLFVRKRAIWQQVFLAPLANFLAKPLSACLSEAGRDELPALLRKKTTTLFFNDGGFFIWHDSDQQEKVRAYFLLYGELPYKVQVLQFRQAGGAA